MGLLSEDPTYLAGGLGVLAVVLLIATRITQQGRFLVYALGALAMASLVLVLEHFWVTDAERIERVVYDVRDAVVAADADRLLTYLTPDVEYVQGGNTTSGETTRAFIRSVLTDAKFDFVRVTQLKAEAFPVSRRGTAVFRIIASGSLRSALVHANFGTTNSDWSLGFEETGPQVWKVNRISPTQISREMPAPAGPGGPRRRGPRSRGPREEGRSPREEGQDGRSSSRPMLPPE